MANKNTPFPIFAVAIGCLCLCCVCVCAILLGGFAWFLPQSAGILDIPSVVEQTLPTQAQAVPLATNEPAPLPLETATPNQGESSLTGSQRLSETYLYDDFSSNSLGWAVFDDGMSIVQIESGEYAFQVVEPDYYSWVYVPVNFSPTDIWFDARPDPASDAGTFGVYCQYQDSDNHYYVEFDLLSRTYVIVEVLDGELIPLTPPNPQGQYWQNSDNLSANPHSVNRIGVSCYLDSITLYINDQYETSVSVSQPLNSAGGMALFVYSFPFADENGYKVYFDNLEAYKPAQ